MLRGGRLVGHCAAGPRGVVDVDEVGGGIRGVGREGIVEWKHPPNEWLMR